MPTPAHIAKDPLLREIWEWCQQPEHQPVRAAFEALEERLKLEQGARAVAEQQLAEMAEDVRTITAARDELSGMVQRGHGRESELAAEIKDLMSELRDKAETISKQAMEIARIEGKCEAYRFMHGIKGQE